ncbi:PIN domain-containing protein [Tundrisphaera sp. TA3]|uniref:PIN domain-containing protein n=1 Tax=Tundrisphaera sp. TA3 TaxID=3435775 RepID=UPI003EB7AEB5
MDLFLDTNIWLSFYHYSNDDLEELRKLVVLIEKEKVTLHVTDQVVDEFWRNRNAKFNDAIKKFKADRLNDQFPQLCKDYEEPYEQMRVAIRRYNEAKGLLLRRLTEDFGKEKLKADAVIKELFAKAKMNVASQAVITRAFWRHRRGNPPGKKDSLGDAINWECLLEHVEDGHDLSLIAEDVDYRMEGSDDEFSPFLEREWSSKKKGKVKYYRRLSAFFNEKFPQIKLATELEKEILIKDLAKSPTFKATRRTLRGLSQVDDLTDDQACEILEAALDNNQVYWIAEEPGVRSILTKLLALHRSALDADRVEEFDRLYAKEKSPEMPEPAVDYGPDLQEGESTDPSKRPEIPHPSVAPDDDDEIPF